MIGWIGNLFILLGILLLSHKRQSGWLCGIAGNLAWFVVGWTQSMPALWSLELIIVALQLHGYYKWTRST